MKLLPLGLPLTESGRIVIAGPCSAESEEQVLQVAEDLHSGGVKIFRAGIWKPRTHPGGFEGHGSQALPWLQNAKRATGMLMAAEVASRQHVEEAIKGGVDLLWIGARTTANPFAVQEIANSLAEFNPDIPVLVKNPVSPDLELWIGALERLSDSGIYKLGAIHRGFSLYGEKLYRNAPIWQIPIELKLRYPELPLLHDPSHTGGKRELVKQLSEEALGMGFDGIMVEVHPEPACALSDREQQLTPAELLSWLADIISAVPERKDGSKLESAEQQSPTLTLDTLRTQIDRIDAQLIELLARRMEVSRNIGELKQNTGLKVLQPERFREMLENRKANGAAIGLTPEFVSRIMKAIHEESVRQQLNH